MRGGWDIASQMRTITEPPAAVIPEIEREISLLGDKIAQVREAIGRVIIGQAQVVDQTLIALLSGGHALLRGARTGQDTAGRDHGHRSGTK